jgi:hypothetical protein
MIRKTLQAHDLVHAWLAARQDRNLDRLASLTAANAVWHSPVEGPRIGRSAVVEEVRRGYTNADSFESELLDVRCPDVTSATVCVQTSRLGKGSTSTLSRRSTSNSKTTP